jgi:trehalose 6-phosphate synthase/phosphatase
MIEKRLIIVSNRLPVNIEGEGDDMHVKAASGGLITAMNSYLQGGNTGFSQVLWAGVPGCSPATWEIATRKIPASDYTYLPVFMNAKTYEEYYNGFSNSVLWPLFHYFPSYAEYKPNYFDHYMKANEHFLDSIVRHARPGDTIWIHDYHLLALADMLRKQLPQVTIGFFLHIPFPSYEIFRLIPGKWQEQLLNGLLGADLIGFHTIDYAAHFLQSIQMILGLDHERHIIKHKNRLVKVDVFPISIDYKCFNNAYDKEEVRLLRCSLLQNIHEKKIIFSVDRLDYTKGVQNRLRAYELFLQNNPAYHGKVVFIMVIVPSRDNIPKYAERKKLIDEMISQINSRIGDYHWQPLIYQYNYLLFDQMLALYTGCDLALITPLRDGMNLVAKEFIASRKDEKGVLVISEMAGAARELTEALTINPNDITEMARKIREGLEMDTEEQGKRLRQMQKRVANYDVQAWADDYISALMNIKQKQHAFQVKFLDDYSRRSMLDAYRLASRRLLLLDYDGTLVPFATNPDLAVPDQPLLDALDRLAKDPLNDVFLISGRNSAWLDQYFSHLPINLVAEHGAKIRMFGQSWRTEVQARNEWKEQVLNIMEMYVRRCAHSFVEEKDYSIVWHFRNANLEHGKLRAHELFGELKEYIHNRHLEVLSGNKIVEVRNSGIDKGITVRNILSMGSYDFIFAVGDDTTDEDMFRHLIQHKHSFTIKVGTEASYAQFNLQTPQMVVTVLEGMGHLSPAMMIV